MDAVISTENLTRRFRRGTPWRRQPVVAVDDVTLEVQAGAIHGLLGPNGAGKTTLMKLVLGLLRPTSGNVLLLGEPHSPFGSPALRRVGALIEEPRFLPQLTGRDNLRQVATLLGGGAAGRIDAALADVGLADRGDDRVKGYSLGMRQRLGLARCLIGQPELLVLDEPTNGMDPQGIADTRALLKRYAREHGAAVLLSSHLLDGVEELCDSLAFMDGGKILRSGSMASYRGTTRSYRLRVDDPDSALSVTQSVAGRGGWTLASAQREGDTLELAIEGEHSSADLNRELVTAGVAVSELVSLTPSLADIYRETIGVGYGVRWTE